MKARPQPPGWIAILVPLIAIIGVALLLIVGAYIKAANAHGDAEWIRLGNYVDISGTHCCGPIDCAVALPGELTRVSGAWLHVPTQTYLMDNEIGIYDSKDAQLWRCVRGGILRCVFPGLGV